MEHGINLIREYGSEVLRTHLRAPLGLDWPLLSPVTIEMVNAPKVLSPDLDNPDHWEEKEVFYSKGVKRGAPL